MKLLVNITINILDVYMIFCILYSLNLNKYKISSRDIREIIILGTFNGLFTSYFDPSKYKVVIYLIMLIVIKRKINDKWHEVFLLFACINVIVYIFQIPIFLIRPLIHEEILSYFIPQVLSAVVIYFISKLKLCNLKIKVDKQILIKFLFYIATIFFMLKTHSDFFSINVANLFFYIILLIGLIGIFSMLHKIYYFTIKYPPLHHDIHNKIYGLSIATESMESLEEIQTALRNFYRSMDVETLENEHSKKKQIDNYINKKVNNKNLIIETNIKYLENNHKVPIETIVLILGILLDNAIEASPPKYPIHIYLRVSKYHMKIVVSNYFNDTIESALTSFNYQFSSKSIYRGYGVNNLRKAVKKYNGEISIQKKTNWVAITTKIEN